MIEWHVTIDRLALEGIDLPPAARPRLVSGVVAELGRLLAEGGLSGDLQAGSARRAVRGGQVELAEGVVDPAALAAQIAGAIYGGLGE